MTFFGKLKKTISNIPGWRTDRKLVVIESDDWGSIRMPDKNTYNVLLSKGIKVDTCPFNRYDCLASEKDLFLLFEVLNGFRDINGNPPILTANSIMVNPDFDKIRESQFREYHYELFTETLKKYPNHSGSFELWKQGIENNVFRPQFHSREHLHVARWMKALRDNLPETRLAFDLRLFGLSTFISNENRRSYLAALDVYDNNEITDIKDIIRDGLQIFQNLFGYKANSFIAPNYIWPASLEQFLSEQEIKYIKGRKIQVSPVLNSTKTKKIYHYTGQHNRHDQVYLITNCQFEPSFDYNKDAVNECLAQVEEAYSLRKPAIIAMHRVNVIGSIEQSNRERNLRLLKDLLTGIQKKWPDVEFFSAEKMGELISSERNGINES